MPTEPEQSGGAGTSGIPVAHRSLPREILTFRRAFILLLALVVVPSAGLSGFGVLAIVNERAAVEKKLEAIWLGRLATVSTKLRDWLTKSKVILSPAGPVVVAPSGEVLSEEPFEIDGERLKAASEPLREDLATLTPALRGLPPGTSLFSVLGPRGAQLIAASRQGDHVAGATLSLPRVRAMLESLSQDGAFDPTVGFELLHLGPAPKPTVGQWVSQVVQGDRAPLAQMTLPAPLQHIQIAALGRGADPVAQASSRNRAIYGVLLGVFYLALGLGVVYTARTLYREVTLSRMKTDFVSLISHELRTPLTSIRMFIETLLLDRVKSELEVKEVLGLLLTETQRLSGLIDRVLEWARIESGRKKFQPVPSPVDEICRTALAALKAQRLDAGSDVLFDLPPGLPWVRVDREAVAGALLNLLQNAFKYSVGKKVELRAHAERTTVAIEVEDHGMGIAKKDRKRIFERFYRVDNLLTRKTEGSGLGLSIAKRIIEEHGGRISVRSQVGQGSCFTIHLPRAS